jgi:hypothetical protein
MQPSVFSVFSVSDMTLLKTNKSNDASRKKRRNHVKQACLPCRRAHTACDETKPCSRCVKQQRPELCVQTAEEYNELLQDEESRNTKKMKREESNPDIDTNLVSGNMSQSTGPPSTLHSSHPTPPLTVTPILTNTTTNTTSSQQQMLVTSHSAGTSQRPLPMLPMQLTQASKNSSPDQSPVSPLGTTESTYSAPLDTTQSSSGYSSWVTPRESKMEVYGSNDIGGLPMNYANNPPGGSYGSSSFRESDTSALSDSSGYNLILNIFNLVASTNHKMDSFITEFNRVRTELNTTKQQQERMMNFFRIIQKQMLYMLHNPIHPIQPGDSAISVWDIHTFKLVDFNPQFEQLVKHSSEVLKSNFYLMNLIPDFFKPFAYDFYNEMMYNMGPDKDPKVAQMMYFQDAEGEEFPVHMSCQPHYDQFKQAQQFVMISRQVAKYS